MSHELRTPLNAILGYAELLVDGIYGAVPERAMGVLERVQNNGKHLLALMKFVIIPLVTYGLIRLIAASSAPMPDTLRDVMMVEPSGATRHVTLTVTTRPAQVDMSTAR